MKKQLYLLGTILLLSSFSICGCSNATDVNKTTNTIEDSIDDVIDENTDIVEDDSSNTIDDENHNTNIDLEDDAEEDSVDDSNEDKFDFSLYAGTYIATDETGQNYGGGKPIEDLILDENGVVSGGTPSYYTSGYPTKEHSIVESMEDGSYRCAVDEESSYWGTAMYIYPVGVYAEQYKQFYSDDDLYTDAVYIRYVLAQGTGVSEMTYYMRVSSDEE